VKIKLDENIPSGLVRVLSNLGHEVDTVPMEGLHGKPDDVVWEAVRAGGRFFVTQDLDFSDAREFAPGTHDGILIVRLRQPGRVALANRIAQVFHNEDMSSLAGCFVVLTERKIRIRRPESKS
jgi:predicted nuclease of predicted toxin-antitoxin system